MNMILKDKTEERKLWEEYRKTHNPKIRETFVNQYIHLAKYIAVNIFSKMPPHIEIDDLISNGYFGLLDAIDRFDITQDNLFKTYAYFRIKGAILDGMREEDFISRGTRTAQKEIERAENDLRQKLYREPTYHEIANKMGIPLLEVVKGKQETHFVAFNNSICVETSNNKKYQPDNIVVEKDIAERILKLLETLLEKERKVLILYYYDELTFKEIGEIYGFTESRACQLHTTAIGKLKKLMGDKGKWL